MLNRHEAEGPRGCELAAGSNTPGPVLIKEARLGGERSRRGPSVSWDTAKGRVLVHVTGYTGMFDRKSTFASGRCV